MPALFYFHVPKTAGTSMINEIMQHFVASETLTENGNLTLPYLQAYGKERLRELGFIHGHPGAGVATYLQGITDTVLLLRNPMDHAISNYLSLLRDPGARLHHVAAGLGFRDFLYAYPRVLAFQTRSLTGGLGLHVRTDRIYDCLPDVFRYLEGTLLLGTVERIDEFITDLANVRQWPAPTSVRHLNRTAENQRVTRDELEEIYVSAARDDRLGTMVAAEQALYAKARSIAATQRGLMSVKRLGQTARRVWQSADGEIVLGKNFGRREMIDGEAAWWTLDACESQIHVTSRTIATLHAEIRISHGIASSCIQVWMDDRKLDARIEQSSDSSCSLVVPLDGLRGDRWATVTLHIVDRLAAIDNPLWHHALLLYRFCLT